jgi:hypothetical protein
MTFAFVPLFFTLAFDPCACYFVPLGRLLEAEEKTKEKG